MKRTIYWSVNRANGHAHYYFDKDQMFRDWGSAKRLMNHIEQFNIVFYALETEITDEFILELLNGEFTHCMLPNYRGAKMFNLEYIEKEYGS